MHVRLSPTVVRLAPEGWYYLFVVGFIIGGAILREVNLLVLLAGLMIGPLLFNWRWVTWSLGDLRVRRTHVARIEAGEELTIHLTVTNGNRALSAWAVRVEDEILTEETGDRVAQAVMIPVVPARGTASGSYQLRALRRGVFQFERLRVSTRFPLGMIRARGEALQRSELIVWPRRGQLSEHWRRTIQQAMVGSRQSQPRKGYVDGDYYGLREWRPGDTRRWIHWRTSARLGTLTVRQFEQQREDDLVLAVDLWQPATPTARDTDRVEQALRFAATAVTDRCRQGGAQLQFLLVDGQLRRWQSIVSQTLAYELLDALARAVPRPAADVGPLLPLADQCARGGRQMIVISTRTADEAGIPGDDHRLIWIAPDEFSQWFDLPPVASSSVGSATAPPSNPSASVPPSSGPSPTAVPSSGPRFSGPRFSGPAQQPGESGNASGTESLA